VKTKEIEEKEEEEKEEEAEETKSMEKAIGKKLDELFNLHKENPVSKTEKYHKENPTLERSVMETDPYLRKIRPFVKLSGNMESFAKDMKLISRGGIPQSMLKALSEGNDSEGGYTVPEEFDSEVIRYATEMAVVRPRATVRSMSRDIVNWAKLDQDPTTDGDDFGGVSLSYVAEGATKPESQPRFGRVRLQAKKLVGLTVASDELLDDSAINVANFLVSLFGEALAYREDKEFLRGTGVGSPLGIINAAGVVEADRETGGNITYKDLLAMRRSLKSVFHPNAVWITTLEGEEKILQINAATTQGVKLIDSLRDGIPTTMLGRPLIVTDKLPSTIGEKGDIIFGDLSRYYIGDRGTIQVASSIHDRFREDETVFRFVKRHDGQPAIPRAFVVLEAKS
jgi:HK97 family phage major capsid protein